MIYQKTTRLIFYDNQVSYNGKTSLAESDHIRIPT